VWNFLDDLEITYSRSDTKNPTNLIKEKLLYYNNPENDHVKLVRTKIDYVKELMVNNFEKLLERGTRLENLEEITNEIKEGAKEFERGSNQVKWNMRKRTAIIVSVLALILIFIIILIVFVACGFPSFYKCKSK
jgi:t-SNARE complex subunit (syntaxin)